MTFNDILAQVPKLIQWESLMTVVSSSLAMNGASLEEVGEILGHRSLEITRRYAHLNYGHTRKVLISMNEVIFG